MSIVGPRPERPEFIGALEAQVPFWQQRELLRPGITGWAQIRAGYAADEMGAERKLSYDLWYLRHRSVLVDLAICAKTIGVIIGGGKGRDVHPPAPEVVPSSAAAQGLDDDLVGAADLVPRLGRRQTTAPTRPR